MKVTRVIEYSGEEADVVTHLGNTLLSKQTVVEAGDVVPGVGPIFARRQPCGHCKADRGKGADGLPCVYCNGRWWEGPLPDITIRLMSETRE